MTAFDDPCLEALDARGSLLRAVGRPLEADPTDWMPLWEDEVLRAVALLEVPLRWNPVPEGGGHLGPGPITYEMQLAVAERIGRHDASCVLAMPTPTMAGHAIALLGNEAQKEAYFSRYDGPPRRSFFAVTEPDVGTDATAGVTALSAGRNRLHVRKKLVGGAAQADCGLIFARDPDTRSHKLVCAGAEILAQLTIKRLPMNGLCGADLTEITGDAVQIAPEAVLGHGNKVGLRDGFFAMNGVFERYRPMIAALAAGSGRGILDALRGAGVATARLDAAHIRHRALLGRLCRAAASYETGTARAQEISALKLEAIAFLEDCVALSLRTLPTGDLFAVPGLLKRLRDARAWEYMEGTSHIHRIQAFRAVEAELVR